MKALLSFLLFSFIILSLQGQDLVYTVKADYQGSSLSLDSILFENLSNGSRILFDNLPDQEDYKINLTRKQHEGPTRIDEYRAKENFSLISNQPGWVELHCHNIQSNRIRLEIFNLQGQKIHAEDLHGLITGSRLQVQLNQSGIYLLSLTSGNTSKTFKAVGKITTGGINTNITHTVLKEQNALKAFVSSPYSDFDFELGDSIRISVYKESYYSSPKTLEIQQSLRVEFIFDKSTVETLGISDGYKDLVEDTEEIEYNNENNEIIITGESEAADLNKGDVVTIDQDTVGYILKVIEKRVKGDSVIIKTEIGNMTDIFADKQFKLNTEFREPDNSLKKSSSKQEIIKALTDEKGYIHPVEIVYHGRYGNERKKSVFEPAINRQSENNLNLINIPKKDFSNTDLYGKSGDNIHFYISEGHFYLFSDAEFDLDFGLDMETVDENTKVRKGKLKSFTYAINAEAEFLTKLALDISKSIHKDGTRTILDFKKVTAKFIVPPGIPVLISFDVDILGGYEFDADASLHADWGFKTNQQLKVGATYLKQTDSFAPIREYENEDIIYPLTLEGEVNLGARLEVYPRIEVKFYNFFGPFAEIVPFVEGEYHARAQTKITPDKTENFMAWNTGLDLGLDFRIGAELSFLGLFTKEFGPVDINCFQESLWESPKYLQCITDLNNELSPGETYELSFRVTDLLGYNVPFCPVYLEGDGTFDSYISFTGTDGEVKVNWTVPSSGNSAVFNASIFLANGSTLNRVEESYSLGQGNSGETGTFTDSRDNKTYKTIKLGNQWWMAENLAYLPSVSPSSAESYTEPVYYVYGYEGSSVSEAKATSNYDTYGTLYNWPAAMSACPAGWHLPSDEEWKELEMHLGMSQSEADDSGWRGTNEGSKLAGNSDLWDSGVLENNAEFGASGFTALPGGYRIYDGYFILHWRRRLLVEFL